MTNLTQILSHTEESDATAAELLLPLVYEELRKLAAAKLAQEKPGQTLQATALVHDAYMRLVGVEKAQHWNSRGHFFGAAAETMRRILVETARRKKRVRHGGGLVRSELGELFQIAESNPDCLLDLSAALERLDRVDPDLAALAKLRLFTGLTNEEAAEMRRIPPGTAKKRWLYARAWLRRELAAYDDDERLPERAHGADGDAGADPREIAEKSLESAVRSGPGCRTGS